MICLTSAFHVTEIVLLPIKFHDWSFLGRSILIREYAFCVLTKLQALPQLRLPTYGNGVKGDSDLNPVSSMQFVHFWSCSKAMIKSPLTSLLQIYVLYEQIERRLWISSAVMDLGEKRKFDISCQAVGGKICPRVLTFSWVLSLWIIRLVAEYIIWEQFAVSTGENPWQALKRTEDTLIEVMGCKKL